MDSISLVLDFTSCLLERGENPFGKALVEMKGTWLESFVLFFFHSMFFVFPFKIIFLI